MKNKNFDLKSFLKSNVGIAICAVLFSFLVICSFALFSDNSPDTNDDKRNSASTSQTKDDESVIEETITDKSGDVVKIIKKDKSGNVISEEKIDKNSEANKESKTNKNNKESSSTTRKVEIVNNTTTKKYSNNSGDSGAITIPEYSGSPYYTIGRTPSFPSSDYTTKSFEKYSALDGLGRCGVAYANVSKDTMPPKNDKRGDISSIKPTGWVQAKYDCVQNKYLYNRCHLIGWQLTDEDANKENLVTGTRYFNVNGMLPFENMVADYIKETGNHVLYRVTPDFRGNELVCRGVQMEAYSVEDKGDGICFNVYVYNVQPGVVINYTTGSSYLEGSDSNTNDSITTTTKKTTTTTTTKKTTTTTTTTAQNVQPTGETYILNTNTKKIHHASCSSVSRMSEANKQEYSGDINELLNNGYSLCGICFK